MGIARTQHKIPAIEVRVRGQGKQFDVVYFRSVPACDAGFRLGAPYRCRKYPERIDGGDVNLAVTRVHEEEPVITPRNVARNGAESIHIDANGLPASIRQYIFNRDFSIRMQRATDRANGAHRACAHHEKFSQSAAASRSHRSFRDRKCPDSRRC